MKHSVWMQKRFHIKHPLAQKKRNYNPRQKSLKDLCTSLSACNVEMLLQSCVATTLQKGGGNEKGAEFSKVLQGFCLRLSEVARNFRSMRKNRLNFRRLPGPVLILPEKILEDAKSLQQSLQEKFTANNRTKRCVPSDSRISPSVSAPSKSLRHATDQGRGKAAKCLSFAEIQPKPNPGPDLLPLVWPVQIVPFEERNISDVNCEGNICQVQVSD